MSDNEGLGMGTAGTLLDGWAVRSEATAGETVEVPEKASRLPSARPEAEDGLGDGLGLETPSCADSVRPLASRVSSVALAEIETMVSADLAGYGRFTLCLECKGRRFAITTCKDGYERCMSDSLPVFVGGEVALLAWGAQLGRLFHEDMTRFIGYKRSRPRWRVMRLDAIGRRNMEVTPVLNLSLGEAFYILDISLVSWEAI